MNHETAGVLWEVDGSHASTKNVTLIFYGENADTWQGKCTVYNDHIDSRVNPFAPLTDPPFWSVCALITEIVRVLIWGKGVLGDELMSFGH